MREAFIVGIGMTKFGVHADKSTADLGREATQLALDEAGIEAKDLDVAFYANTA